MNLEVLDDLLFDEFSFLLKQILGYSMKDVDN
jgi:hypothetical protein